MAADEETKYTWKDLANLIASLPEEDQERYQRDIKGLVHDLRQCLAIHHSAEALLRRTIPPTPENVELLDSIRTANQRALTLVSDFAQPFDHEDTLPLE
jgi:signal transduction histidine kinase